MQLEKVIHQIVGNNFLHAKWLNTLSLMENTGARKISAGEHPIKVNLIVLKHAAEESRHAYYLKKQIAKLQTDGFEDYNFKYLIAPVQSYHYLQCLDVAASRYLREKMNLSGYNLSFGAYLLVTYAIEVRADELYGIYQSALDKVGSKVNVKSIIIEEEGHLEEMIQQLKNFDSDWENHAQAICKIENLLFDDWVKSIASVCETNDALILNSIA
jgi:bacterioferritin (cytochrome b1)